MKMVLVALLLLVSLPLQAEFRLDLAVGVSAFAYTDEHRTMNTGSALARVALRYEFQPHKRVSYYVEADHMSNPLEFDAGLNWAEAGISIRF